MEVAAHLRWAEERDCQIIDGLYLRAARSLRAGLEEELFGALSAREREVARLMIHGASNHEIAATLFLSPKTVESHVASVRRKLGGETRSHMIERARDLGLG